MPSTMPELLCPAGDENALHAAIDCGADAVYLGYRSFGARASAVNFDAETLQRAVSYAHLYHARVYVTVNTLVKPHEMAGMLDALRAISASGADAIIVQEAGVAAAAKKHFPSLSLHASTQMAICNASGALTASALGFERVVLARECPLEEIKKVTKTGIETEVFAHGALCTAVSGRCLMSSLSGGRSGNRGRCAQPCRQMFSTHDAKGALLSLRDLCLIDDLPKLCMANVTSLKLEGRLKSAEYVAVIASVYRKALDEIASGTFRPYDENRKNQLLQIYNRGGFTKGHVMGAQDSDLVTPERVSHEGVPLGQIIALRGNLASLRVDRTLNDGDSLQLRGSTEHDLRYSGHDVPAGGVATLRLRPGIHTAVGTKVSRLSDAKQLAQARNHQPKPIPVSMKADFSIGKDMLLTVSDGVHSVTVAGDPIQAAKARSATQGDVKKHLSKLGGTPFVLNDENRDLTVHLDDGLFLPVSALNELRRNALAELAARRIHTFAKSRPVKTDEPFPTASSVVRPDLSESTLAVITPDACLCGQLAQCGASIVVYAPRTFTVDALKESIKALPEGTWLRLPPQMSESTLAGACELVNEHQERIGGVWAESIGQLGLNVPVPVIAGEGIPVTNREGMQSLQKTGLSAFTFWTEWNAFEQKEMLPLTLPSFLKCYGRDTLMLLNHCPERVKLGLSANRSGCRICTDETMAMGSRNPVLTDRKNYQFPVRRTVFDEGCELSVYSALPTDLRQYHKQRLSLGAGVLLHFTTETREQQMALTNDFKQMIETGDILPTETETTSGHWTRGVE